MTQREKGCHGDVKEPDVEANQAMLRLVTLAAAPLRPVADNVKDLVLEHANGASPVRNKCLEHDLEKNRVSADDNFNERSLIHDKGTPPRTKSVFTRHKPAVTTGAICSTSDQPDLLEQSLLPICSREANAGLNGHDAVSPILKQVFPGLIEGDDRLAVSQPSPAGEENKSLIIVDSEISRGETVSSSDMIEAAIQLQKMQKSYSNSLCSGVVELSETPSIHCGNQEAAQNQTKGILRRSEVGPNYTDVTAMNHKASSSASKSQNVAQADQSESQCKRDDGKGWRCSRPAEGGYTMCKYHREQICRAQSRRKRSKFETEPIVAEKTSPSRYLLNARFVPSPIFTASDCLPFTDDELAYDERRPFVKAKSLKSLLLNTY